jgi:mannose-P-dolichol utilization defect 1
MVEIAVFVSKCIGYAILLSSFSLKLPQIYNIVKNKSASGLSAVSLYGDVVMYFTSIAYNYLQNNPFSSYGEQISVMAQNMIIVVLYWNYSRTSLTSIATALTIFASIVYISLQLPSLYQPVLILSNLPLLIGSRVPQLIKNYDLRSTGPLSAISTALSLTGAAVRILTTIAEVGWDFSLLSSYLVSVVLNGTLLLQVGCQP